MSPLTQVIYNYCYPHYTLNHKQCSQRIKKCSPYGVHMKWTGAGCKDSNKKSLGDGGCQCTTYCGYQCPSACNKDKTCYWNSNGYCSHKGSTLPAGPMPICSNVNT
jgi:hypothetical protein